MGLIDSVALAEEIESLDITVAGKPARWYNAKHTVLRTIAEQKEFDAVPVVRCKDCEHWKRNVYVNTECGLCNRLSFIGITMREDDFCSYGNKRKDITNEKV